jgi:putative ABC transport system ATP-binding protein
MSLIEFKNVKKIYHVGTVAVAALNGVDVAIDHGELVSIMGASGSGKSTLLNMIGALDIPTSGTYKLDGEDVGSMSDDRLAEARNRKIGFVFQTFNLLPRLTALANVELALVYGRATGAHKKSIAALESVGLGDRMDHRPTQMSGGQQQRVGIARALVKEPPLLLADEPTGNLDSQSTNEIIAMLQRLNDEQRITVVIVTHEHEVAEHTRRIITMRDGKVVSDEPNTSPRQVKTGFSGGAL